MDEQANDGRKKTWTEEIEVAGGQLIERVKALVAEGNVRELRVKAAGGQVIFETPVTVGVLAGGALALAAPWLAILGAIAALVARVKIEVVREAEGESVRPTASKPRARASAKKPARAKAKPTAKAGAKATKRASPARKPRTATKA